MILNVTYFTRSVLICVFVFSFQSKLAQVTIEVFSLQRSVKRWINAIAMIYIALNLFNDKTLDKVLRIF